jgi:hypothetical protein
MLFKRSQVAAPASPRMAALHEAYEEAAADPAYQEEMTEINHAFDATIADGLEPFDRRG